MTTSRTAGAAGGALLLARYQLPRAVVYDSQLAAERIKHEIGQGDTSIFKLGFFVDCYVEKLRGRPVACRVTAVRNIISLPDDTE